MNTYLNDVPAPRRSRVEAIDLARGLALIGMIMAHLGPTWTGRNPPVPGLICDGRAAPLFAMLAGVALTLVHRRDPEGAGSVRATCLRAALLVALGLTLASLPSMRIEIILAFYGVLIVAALPFRRLSTRALFGLGLVWAVVVPVAMLWLEIHQQHEYNPQPSWDSLRDPLSLATDLLVWGTYPAAAWFAYVLIGMGVGRVDLRRTSTVLSVLGGGLVLLTTSLGLGLLGIMTYQVGPVPDGVVHGWRQLLTPGVDGPSWRDLWVVGQHTTRPLDVIGTIGSALVVIGLCAAVTRVPWLRLPLRPLRAAGAMTLTLYTVHALWTMQADVGALPYPFLEDATYGPWLLQVTALCTFATVWLHFRPRGPLESVVRVVSTVRLPRDRRRGSTPDPARRSSHEDDRSSLVPDRTPHQHPGPGAEGSS